MAAEQFQTRVLSRSLAEIGHSSQAQEGGRNLHNQQAMHIYTKYAKAQEGSRAGGQEANKHVLNEIHGCSTLDAHSRSFCCERIVSNQLVRHVLQLGSQCECLVSSWYIRLEAGP